MMPPLHKQADVAQLVEQLTRNEQVSGSNPLIGSINFKGLREWPLFRFWPGFTFRWITGPMCQKTLLMNRRRFGEAYDLN
jgi:hypothetical protein